MFGYLNIMVKRRRLNVSLPEDLGRFVELRVSEGEYDSPDEVIRAALRSLRRRKRTARSAVLEELREKIAVGLRQARRGELLDGDAVFDELERRARKRATRRA